MRVFIVHAHHEPTGGRYFSRGAFVGKRAMCSVTIGGSSLMYSDRGAYGPIESALFPIHHGILSFTGFSVLEPFLVFAPARASDTERRDALLKYKAKILELATATACAPLDLTGYDGLSRRV
jgi:NAD(P)H dehydrogenase (quinone)